MPVLCYFDDTKSRGLPANSVLSDISDRGSGPLRLGISCRDGRSAAFFALAESTGTQPKIQGTPSILLNAKVLRNKWKSMAGGSRHATKESLFSLLYIRKGIHR